MKTKLYICLLVIVVMVQAVQARVKLVALPERARVVVSLNNPEATLVEEERQITLQKGVNNVDFSWRGVNIDANSIQVRILAHPERMLAILRSATLQSEAGANHRRLLTSASAV